MIDARLLGELACAAVLPVPLIAFGLAGLWEMWREERQAMNAPAERPAVHAPNEPAPWEPAELPGWAVPLIEREGWDAVFASAVRGYGKEARRVWTVTIKAGTDGRVNVGHWGDDPDSVVAVAIGRVRKHLAGDW